jgi:hypothetical protein
MFLHQQKLLFIFIWWREIAASFFIVTHYPSLNSILSDATRKTQFSLRMPFCRTNITDNSVFCVPTEALVTACEAQPLNSFCSRSEIEIKSQSTFLQVNPSAVDIFVQTPPTTFEEFAIFGGCTTPTASSPNLWKDTDILTSSSPSCSDALQCFVTNGLPKTKFHDAGFQSFPERQYYCCEYGKRLGTSLQLNFTTYCTFLPPTSPPALSVDCSDRTNTLEVCESFSVVPDANGVGTPTPNTFLDYACIIKCRWPCLTKPTKTCSPFCRPTQHIDQCRVNVQETPLQVCIRGIPLSPLLTSNNTLEQTFCSTGDIECGDIFCSCSAGCEEADECGLAGTFFERPEEPFQDFCQCNDGFYGVTCRQRYQTNIDCNMGQPLPLVLI